MSQFASQPLRPFSILLDTANLSLLPQGPVVTRCMSDLDGLFADHESGSATVADNDPVVYTVRSSPVPEIQGELPQSITTILPGGACHNYGWALENGFGKRVFAGSTAPELRTY